MNSSVLHTDDVNWTMTDCEDIESDMRESDVMESTGFTVMHRRVPHACHHNLQNN